MEARRRPPTRPPSRPPAAALSLPARLLSPPPVAQAESYDLLGPQCLQDPEDPGAVACMTQLARSLITATAASSLISTFFIGYFGNLPLALAPGIGARRAGRAGRVGRRPSRRGPGAGKPQPSCSWYRWLGPTCPSCLLAPYR